MMDMSIHTLELPPELRDRVAELARQDGTTVSQIVRQGMQRYIEQIEQGEGSAALHKNNKP